MTRTQVSSGSAVGLVLLAVVAAACSGSDQAPISAGEAADGADATVPSGPDGDADAPDDRSAEVPDGAPDRDEPLEFESFEALELYLAQAAEIPLADADSAVPPYVPEAAAGAPGFTRYVFRDVQGEIIPSLVEGPLGRQVRCQDPALPCSFNDLVALADEGADIPAALDMTAAELDRLVAELTVASGVIEHYADVDTACADGFVSDRTQTANMGSHFFHLGRIADNASFDPGEPEILLYAVAGDKDPGGQLGHCQGGRWTGVEMEITGVSYYLPRDRAGDDHPGGFSGDLDNWHLHYNLCRGAGADAILTQADCAAAGGSYSNAAAWMIHAWANPERDNQLGVFSMWNPSIWPISDPAVVAEARIDSVVPDAGQSVFSISNFRFDTVEAVAGEEVVFANADSVPHTITAGSPDGSSELFDSGVLAPSESFSLTFDQGGEYNYFCALHPGMQGTIIVG